jgi:hypothetical protein
MLDIPFFEAPKSLASMKCLNRFKPIGGLGKHIARDKNYRDTCIERVTRE